jgi:hypothetical protein
MTVQRQITLKQNPNPNEDVAAANKVPKVVQDPLDVPLLGSNKIQDPKTKKTANNVAAPGQILDVNLFGRFPSTPNEFRPKTSAIGSVMKLYLQPYKEHRKLSPYATWVSVLVNTAPGLRDGLKNESQKRLDWASYWSGRLCYSPKVVAKVEDSLHHS